MKSTITAHAMWILPFISFLLYFTRAGMSQKTDGFLSINCGGDGFTDPDTGITWSGDEDYLDSAENLHRVGAAIQAKVNVTAFSFHGTSNPLESNRENSEALKTAMMFLPSVAPRSKYCYNLPIVGNRTNWLLRVMFPISDLIPKVEVALNRSLTEEDISFKLSVDATVIKTVTLDRHQGFSQTVEMVVTAQNNPLYVCLLPLNNSICAISSIELRPLSEKMYLEGRERIFQSPEGTEKRLPSTYLVTVSRLNFGGDLGDDFRKPALRFPEDPYDRLWYAPRGWLGFGGTTVTSNTTEGTVVNEFPNFNYPTAVVESAVVGGEISFSTSLNDYLRDPASYYISLCFLDVTPANNTETDRREVSIRLEDRYQPYIWEFTSPIYRNKTVIWSNSGEVFTYDPDIMDLSFEISSGFNSSLPALINAFEIQEEILAADRTPDNRTWLAKTFLSAFKKVTNDIDVSGDPCQPIGFTWNVVECDNVYSAMYVINLSGRSMNGPVPPTFPLAEVNSRLDIYDYYNSIDNLDLSNNTLYGIVSQDMLEFLNPKYVYLDNNLLTGFNFSSKIQASIEILSLNNNSIDTAEFVKLINHLPQTLRSLSISGNQLTGSLLEETAQLSTSEMDLSMNQLTDPLPLGLFNNTAISELYLNLSGNLFKGPIPAEAKFMTSLYSLDLSNNIFSGSMPSELANFPSLRYLSMANNSLTGEVPAAFWTKGPSTLKLQNNTLTGMIPANIWSATSSLKEVDLGYNHLTSINLTTFCEELSSSNFTRVNVTAIHNTLTKVFYPHNCATVFEHLDEITPELFAYDFTLLGGNPWCNNILPENRKRLERYLCRYTSSEPFTPQDWGSVAPGRAARMCSSHTALEILQKDKRTSGNRRSFGERGRETSFFKYDDIKSFTNNFSEEKSLGQGAFGAVYKAIQGDGSIVAVKVLFSTEQNIADFLKEMVVITGIKHRHLLQLKGCCVRDNKRFLIYEFAENNSLAEALWGKDAHIHPLSWQQRFNICVGMARGLTYLHEELQPKIIHRDIKPQNILLDKDWNAKIADFGLARPLHEDVTQMATTIGGTLGYFSPEYATMGFLTEKLDVYSYGIVLLEIVSGRRCIDFSLPGDQMYLRTLAFKLYTEGRLEDIAEQSMVDSGSRDEILTVLRLALVCLHDDPSKRPTMSEVLTTLVGKSADLAVELVTHLSSHQKEHLDRFQQLLSASITTSKSPKPESEENALLRSRSDNDLP